MADGNMPMPTGMNQRLPMPPGFPPQGSGGGGGFSLTPKEIFQILRKRKWLILSFLLLFVLASAVTTHLWMTYAPQYTATARIEVRPSVRAAVGDAPELNPWSQFMPEILATHALQITSTEVVNRALALDDDPQNDLQLNIRSLEWFAKDPATAAERLDESLRAAPISDTSLIAVRVTANDPETAARLATAVAKAYEIENMESTEKFYFSHLRELEDRRKEKEQEADEALQAIRRLAAGSAPPSVKSHIAVLLQQQTLLKMELKGQLELARVALAKLEQMEAQDLIVNSDEAAQILGSDPVYNQTLMLRTRLYNELNELKEVYGENHQSVKKLQQKLMQAQQQVEFIEKQATANLVSEARARVELLESQIAFLESDIQANESRLTQIGKTEKELTVTERLSAALQAEVARLQRSIDETRTKIKNEQPVRMRNMAERPKEISQPKWSLMIPAGVVVGLLVGLGITLLLEVADSSIKRPSDISKQVDLPLLGVIPHADDLEEDVMEVAMALQTHPDSPIGEAFRQVRTRLMFSGPLEEQRTLLVASPSPEDGRTVVATNLAVTMAQSGSQVLLVDANFRQPKISQIFDGCDGAGLSNAMVEQSDWRDMIHEVRPNLFVLGAGPLPPNPAELLGSNSMRDIVAEMGQRFDRVIFDCGPSLVVTDPIALGAIVDGVILTVRAGVNSTGVAVRARNTIRESGGHILGAVLNGVKAMSGGYLRKHYETFYEYREPASLPPAV
jgi:succinoglycan biosynthesis transport protein ExoP